MFHGTRLFLYKLLSTFSIEFIKVLVNRNKCMFYAPDHVSSLFFELTNINQPLQSTVTLENNALAVIAPKSCVLTLGKSLAIEDCAEKRVNNKHVHKHDIFIVSGKLLTSSSYTHMCRRNNSALVINGNFYIIDCCFRKVVFLMWRQLWLFCWHIFYLRRNVDYYTTEEILWYISWSSTWKTFC